MPPHFVVAFKFETARIYERKRSAAPLAIRINPVASYARSVFDDSDSTARKSVEKRRFSDVWSSYDSHQRFHIVSPFPYFIYDFWRIKRRFRRFCELSPQNPIYRFSLFVFNMFSLKGQLHKLATFKTNNLLSINIVDLYCQLHLNITSFISRMIFRKFFKSYLFVYMNSRF